MKDSTLVTLAGGVHVALREPGVLQFGLDATRSGIIETPFAEDLRPLLAGLSVPMKLGAAREMLLGINGLTENAARSLIDDLLTYRILIPASTATVAMIGNSVLAIRLRKLLEETGVTVRVPSAKEAETRFLNRLGENTPLVVVDSVAQHISIDRKLASHRFWHVPVMMLDSRVVVGPIGRGDAGPCLVCAEFYLLDSDSALHSLAAALPDGPAAPDPVVIAAGSSAAAVLIRALAGAPLPPGVVTSPPQAGATVTVDPFGPVPVRTDHLRVHPRCPVCADAMGGTSA